MLAGEQLRMRKSVLEVNRQLKCVYLQAQIDTLIATYSHGVGIGVNKLMARLQTAGVTL